MDYKQVYEKFWKMNAEAKFEDYSRNLSLDIFFPITKVSKKVLDVAGGSGIVSSWLAQRGYDVYMTEFSDVAIEQATNNGVNNITRYEIKSGNVLPFDDCIFDMVFFGDIIEHLFDSECILKEIKRILKPSGRLIISCPNIAYWRFRSYYLIDGDLRRVDVAKQNPWEQEHIRFFNVKILKEYLGKLDFDFLRYVGVNDIWHAKYLVNFFPNLFAHTIILEFEKK